ncbi:Protein MEMO1 [Fukomys damarensis]|uniref:Protein MEMO1 n=1 Tax=Fukomys damarensis TaxID=885580 RepID=A0A091EFV4_FUKDA|nr:Protein MEMO1 [Fukomys damarensis]
MFERRSLQADEGEHSIERHLPYTAKAVESSKNAFAIVPVLVGALSESKEQEFGKLFGNYLANPSNLFVVSSDSTIGVNDPVTVTRMNPRGRFIDLLNI